MADWLSGLLGLGSAAIGAAGSIYAGNQAAEAGSEAADKAAGVQRELYYQTRADTEPARRVGEQGLYSFADLLGIPRPAPTGGYTPAGGFQTTPGYQFRLGEGLKALDRSAAARGMLMSGAQQKAIQRYGEGLAADEWNNYANRVASLAGLGQTATGQQVQANQALGSGLANAALAGGQARVSGYANMGNTIGSVAQSIPLYAYLYGRDNNQDRR